MRTLYTHHLVPIILTNEIAVTEYRGRLHFPISSTMPTIVSSPFNNSNELNETLRLKVERSNADTTPKRRLRSDSVLQGSPIYSRNPPRSCSPMKWKSPRRCINHSPNTPANEMQEECCEKSPKLPVKRLSDSFLDKPKWNPRDPVQLSAVKEALHVSTVPSMTVCRENEQRRVLEFCKQCIEKEKAGSLYVCGCPGTGKSLSMERVKESLIDWAKEEGFQPPDVLAINCTSLAHTSEIFSKILEKNQLRKKTNGSNSPLQHLQNLFSQKQQSTGMKMMLIIADELDYLITRDRAVLHDLFMLTTLPFSRCILIGVANAIDLADRFLPRLQSLNCKPAVITFRAYYKDQIITILQQRLTVLPYTVFQSQALELCARKVAAASGDMRKALCICRSAIEMLEAELRESSCNLNMPSVENVLFDQHTTPARESLTKQEIDIVRVDHMATALSKTYRSPIVDTIQSLPQHQQIILCSAVKLFRRGKKDTTIGELSKFYMDICKSILIPPVGIMELSSMCRVLGDQGLLKLGQSREDKLRRVTLKVDEADITFALQGFRVFRNCLQ
ncbi:cell division control protein 6 homolog B-like [Cornus florida]|uniref:cell division control protein 6 homolog B-like n=1 Tax=Cornus florida TaxID=4283 RepID=UPI00289703ED|nr:cell division control protein 6 homolog B-like [Cornus florida]